MTQKKSDLPKRLQLLKEAYLNFQPSITIGRALAYTEIAKKYPELPRNVLRAKGLQNFFMLLMFNQINKRINVAMIFAKKCEIVHE